MKLGTYLPTGGDRMRRLTVCYADIWTASGLETHNTLDGIIAAQERVDADCREAGRDPASLARMADVVVEPPLGAGRTAAWTEIAPIAGTTDEIAATFRAIADAGITHATIWIEPNNIAGLEAFAPVIEALQRA